jgi:hypothetical protein
MQESPGYIGSIVGLGIVPRLLVQDTLNDICPNWTSGHEEYLQQDIILQIETSLKTRGNPSTATPRLRSRLPASGAKRIAWKNRQRDIGGIRTSAASPACCTSGLLNRDATVFHILGTGLTYWHG